MNDSIKLKAPKPIKVTSNYNGIKYNNNHLFEKIDTDFNSFTPKIRKINYHCPPRVSSFTCYEKQFNSQCAFKFDESTFDKTVEKDFQMLKINDEDSLCKSEILSILKSDSFFNENRFSQDEEDNYFDDIRTSLPPRTSNPLYRHLDSTASVEYKMNNLEILDESFSKLKEMNFEEKINE